MLLLFCAFIVSSGLGTRLDLLRLSIRTSEQLFHHANSFLFLRFQLSDAARFVPIPLVNFMFSVSCCAVMFIGLNLGAKYAVVFLQQSDYECSLFTYLFVCLFNLLIENELSINSICHLKTNGDIRAVSTGWCVERNIQG